MAFISVSGIAEAHKFVQWNIHVTMGNVTLHVAVPEYESGHNRQVSAALGLTLLGGAAAFAFTGVLSFASVVARFATTLTFTGILSLAGMCTLVRQGLERDSGLIWCACCISADREGSGHETRHRGTRDECFRCVHFFVSCFLELPAVRQIEAVRGVQKGFGTLGDTFHQDYAAALPNGSSIFPPFFAGNVIDPDRLTVLGPESGKSKVAPPPKPVLGAV